MHEQSSGWAERLAVTQKTRRSQDTVSAGTVRGALAMLFTYTTHRLALQQKCGVCRLGSSSEGGEKRGVITLFGHRKLRDTQPTEAFCWCFPTPKKVLLSSSTSGLGTGIVVGKAEKKHWPSDALVTLFRYHLARASLGRVSRGLNPNFSRRLRRGSTATRPEGVFAMAC
jgi:hypothetical protein